MKSNHPVLLNNSNRLYHISEEPGIPMFNPRPSPSHFEGLSGDVVFAINQQMLHNYLLPRDCPRVTYYASGTTTTADRKFFFGESKAEFVIAVESGWYEQIRACTLYCYEFSAAAFEMLDACAGYYISYKSVEPLAVIRINDVIAELLKRNVELRFTPSLIDLASAVAESTLNYSIIRMRNAKQ